MKTFYYFRRDLNGHLRPHGDDAADMVRRLKPAELVRVHVSRPRNLRQHNYYQALCRKVADNHATLVTREMVDQALRILTGHVDLVRIGDQILKIPRSINFDSMSQTEFEEFLTRAKDAICSELLPGVELKELDEAVRRDAA